MGSRDRIVGGVLLILSVVVMIAAWNLPETGAADPMGPKFYPLALAVILAAFAIALIAGKQKNDGAKLTRTTVTKGFLPILLLLVLYVALMPTLGFVISTIGLLLSSFFLKGERKWGLNLTVAVGSTLMIYLLFARLLNVPLKLLPAF